MFGYINKKKAIAIVKDDAEYYRKLSDHYLARIPDADNEEDKARWKVLSDQYFARMLEADRILILLTSM